MSDWAMPTLGVNLDHIATLRQLRGTPYPSLVEAGKVVERAGAHQVTVHLREDRRHIQDDDLIQLKRSLSLPLNLEMALTSEMLKIASKIKPEWVCFVPEKREEVTTEGGLDLNFSNKSVRFKEFARGIRGLRKIGIQVSCFIEPNLQHIKCSLELGADAVELHTGRFCSLTQARAPSQPKIRQEILRIKKAAEYSRKQGLMTHAGHGFDYQNIRMIAGLDNGRRGPLIQEFNIGHSIVCRAALVGLERAIREMLSAIQAP